MNIENIDLSLNGYPEWVEATKKLADLHRQSNENRENINKVGALIREGYNRSKPSDVYMRDAKSLLGMESSSEFNEESSLSELQDRMNDLKHEEEVLKRALKLQEEEITKLRSRLSHTHSQKLKPAYLAISRKMAKALGDYLEAAKEEEQFRGELVRNDIAFMGAFVPTLIPNLADLSNPVSHTNQFFKACERNGAIEQGEFR